MTEKSLAPLRVPATGMYVLALGGRGGKGSAKRRGQMKWREAPPHRVLFGGLG